MTIKTGQKMYRLRGPDGLWAMKGDYSDAFSWTDKEERATFWRKLAHLKTSLKHGVLSTKLNGLPHAAMNVVEYEVTIVKTGRKHRLSELDRFYEKGTEDGETDV